MSTWMIGAGAGAVLVLAALSLACGGADGASGGTDSLSGEVRFSRAVELPAGAVVTVTLEDTSLADAAAVELGRAVIADAARLPVRFRVEYDAEQIDERREYTLSARVEADGELLYVNDTVHPVLSGGAPDQRDVLVVSTNPFDQCVAPLPGRIYASVEEEAVLPPDAVLELRLWDISEPEQPVIVSETRLEDVGSFPIDFALPHEGVAINRHHRYELEAELWFDGAVQFHIPRPDLRRVVLPHCPDAARPLIADVFPVQ